MLRTETVKPNATNPEFSATRKLNIIILAQSGASNAMPVPSGSSFLSFLFMSFPVILFLKLNFATIKTAATETRKGTIKKSSSSCIAITNILPLTFFKPIPGALIS